MPAQAGPPTGLSHGGVPAVQAALAAEQAAIYGYGVAGAHLAGPPRAAATADWIAHQVASEKLTALLTAGGVTPVAAQVAYQLPHRVSTPAQAIALAISLEELVTSAYLGLVALADESLRTLGARQVRVAALRAASWRGSTVAFPGLGASALAGPAASRGRRGRA